MSGGVGGLNGPAVVNGGADSYDRILAFDAPVALDSGLYVYPAQTLAQLRTDLMVLLGFATMTANPPPGMVTTLNLFLRLAQIQQYSRYAMLRTERWWPWQISAGQRFYDVPVDGLDALDFRRITAAAIADNGGVPVLAWLPNTAYALGAYVRATTPNSLWFKVTVAGTTGASAPAWPTTEGAVVANGTVTFTAVAPLRSAWYPLTAGIPFGAFNSDTPGRPQRFELREYLEVWPTPDQPYVVYLKGHMGVRRFTLDTDLSTIDPEVILLFATAMAKAHYRQPDANNYAQMATAMGRQLTMGTHGLNRYIPRADTAGMVCADERDASMPRATWRG